MRFVLLFALTLPPVSARNANVHAHVKFQTSDRCIACHNGLTTPSGQDVSIGFDWRASIMANSSRDPYWQASVRRETLDHPEARPAIEDECSVCHMPIPRYEAKLAGRLGQVFVHLAFAHDKKEGSEAADGVTCSVCHQIGKEKLGTRASFNGGFVIDQPSSPNDHPEYGPFEIASGQKLVMQSSTGGFLQTTGGPIRDSQLCATCHTLYTVARSPSGQAIAQLPEQMPYLEWLHSEYRDQQSCQHCHMPEVPGAVPIARVLGVPRVGLHRHVFIGGNFFLQGMLNRYRDDLEVVALPAELASARHGTIDFLRAKTATVSIDSVELAAGELRAVISVENRTGHKFPTAYPSRRAWLHFLVRDRDGRILFESGALNPDGSIQGNDNDADPTRFESHYREITRSDQVEIYEPILKDSSGRVTTGLLSAIGYLKDNRLLPHGFDKSSANPDIAVYGAAAADPDFTDQGSRIRYAVPVGNALRPYSITVELWYEPIGYRWANNLKPYDHAAEPRRFNAYYDAMDSAAAVRISSHSVQK